MVETHPSNTSSPSSNRKLIALGNDSDLNLTLQVPLAIGTLQWGTTLVDQQLINPRGCISETEARAIVQEFHDANVTLYDTAEGYGGGTSEKRLGRLTSQIYTPASSSSSSLSLEPILMTKFLPVPWRFTHRHFENALRASLKRMRIKCCAIYLIHTPVHCFRSLDYWVQSAAVCKRKGLLLALGLSNCNAREVRCAVEAGRKYGVPVVLNQVHYSLLDYNSSALLQMEAVCKELNVKIIAYSPIGQGLLTDKLVRDKFHQNRITKMLRLQWDDLVPLRTKLKEIAKKYGEEKTMAQVALNWCIAHNTIPLVGCRSVGQAKDILGALGWSLDIKDVKELDRLALKRSTLESPRWRRMIFVTLAGVVMMVCRSLDYWGFGMVKEARL